MLNVRFKPGKNAALTLNQKEIPMKIKSVSRSAFFTPRAFVGLGLGATGVLLAVFAFFAFPSTARADAPCTNVVFTEEDEVGEYGEKYVLMSSVTGCTIYYTVHATMWPANPTHTSAVYNPSNDPNYEGLQVPVGQRRYYKAFAHKTKYNPHDWDSPGTTGYVADNTQQ